MTLCSWRLVTYSVEKSGNDASQMKISHHLDNRKPVLSLHQVRTRRAAFGIERPQLRTVEIGIKAIGSLAQEIRTFLHFQEVRCLLNVP